MSIGSLSPYRLPTSADCASSAPPGTASWRLDRRRAGLLIHDMQRYFLAPFHGARQPIGLATDNMAALAQVCAKQSVPVIYTAQPPHQDPSVRGLLTDFWGPGLSDDSQAAITPRLAPKAHDTVITKWRYSAFVRTGLADELSDRGIDQLIVCGVYAHIGITTTVLDAFMRDIQCFVPCDAVADFSAADHQRALAFIATRAGVVTTTKQAIDALSR